jgi:hypothetical protein
MPVYPLSRPLSLSAGKGLAVKVGGVSMSLKRKRCGRPCKRYTLACDIVGRGKTVLKKAFHRIFERIGANLQNELKLNPENSLVKNKKRIKLNHEKARKNKKRIVAKNEKIKTIQLQDRKNFLSPFYKTNPL